MEEIRVERVKKLRRLGNCSSGCSYALL